MKNKKEDLIVLLFIIIAVTAFAFNYKLTVGDEIWNFSNMYKMSQGYTIYKDLNVIITPFIFYIGEILFKIFGGNILVEKVLNVCICVYFFFLIYKIFEQLKLDKVNSIFYTIVIYWEIFYITIGGANYNILALVFCFIGILFILKHKPYWIQGIIIFLIFMTKQNIGIYYLIGYVITKIIEVIQNAKAVNKENIKQWIKELMIPIGIFIVLFAIYLLYLYTQNNLYNFINYTFLGISEFGRKNLAFDTGCLIYLLIIALMVYPMILFMLNFKKFNINKEIKQKAYVLMSFSVPLLFIAYPLINRWHTDLGIITTIIFTIYVIEKSFLEELANNKIIKNIKKIIIGLFLILITIFSIVQNVQYFNALKTYDYYDVYYGALIDNDVKKEIDEIVNYINEEDKQTIVLSYYSNLYMNILDRNNEKMDLPFYGNLGKEGEDGLIEEIKELQNTNLLILKEEDKEYQESKKVRNYVIENYKQIGEIGRFFIYDIENP